MIPKKLLAVLAYALPVLVVAFGVVMGGYALSQAAEDKGGACGLWWTAMALLMVLAADVILLVGVLGLGAVSAEQEEEGE